MPFAFFIEGYMSEHDRNAYPIHCIDVSPYPEDAVTARLRTLADQWHRVGELDEDALAEYIRLQSIDVLVDLSGHTGHHRLLTFAQRPAPVQVSWFGYMNTTGLTAIDYRLTDAAHDPPGETNRFYTEELFHIPSLACFTPDAGSPDVGPPPFLRNGYMTFASANQWTKVTAETRSLWAEILIDAARPKLIIVARGAENAQFRQDIIDEFVRFGVDAQQLDVRPLMPLGSFLAFLNEVDVALDPFPYGGGSTSLNCIWMGVPIVSLEGDSELGRATPSMLRAFGLQDLVAHSRADYRERALSLVHQAERSSTSAQTCARE
jgi:predicted O-linked N-acetylglucosamine transferase (SPINDLY family)